MEPVCRRASAAATDRGSHAVGLLIGFVGPLAIGWTLDGAAGMSPLAWGLAFGLVAIMMAVVMMVSSQSARASWKAIMVSRCRDI